jgi:hypothetical protein
MLCPPSFNQQNQDFPCECSFPRRPALLTHYRQQQERTSMIGRGRRACATERSREKGGACLVSRFSSWTRTKKKDTGLERKKKREGEGGKITPVSTNLSPPNKLVRAWCRSLIGSASLALARVAGAAQPMARHKLHFTRWLVSKLPVARPNSQQ